TPPAGALSPSRPPWGAAPPGGSPADAAMAGAARVVVDLVRTDAGVHGQVSWAGNPDPLPFVSWLDLLRVLEAVEPPHSPAPSLAPVSPVAAVIPADLREATR
ncbi:hypothetical protein, partial [Frankia nepalensis]|uniref:hypothetical protein n=1 Tax=Frankia nepalensis TaxID=1836974 RepID=UPI001EE4CE10